MTGEIYTHKYVIFVAMSQRLGSFPKPAILDPRWCRCQKKYPSFEPKIQWRRSGWCANSGGALPQKRIFCPKIASCGPKRA